ncbi:Type-1 restriction enzyme EcoKI specificity protein [subsurface metagenome]
MLLERITEEQRRNAKGKVRELPPLNTSDLPELPEGWIWTGFGTIVESMQNGIYKQRHFYSDDGVACLRMYNIEDGKIIWKDIKRMSLTTDEIDRYGLKFGDILVNRVNSRELVGKTAPIPSGLETCVYESKNIRIRLLDGIESKYVAFWFQVFAQRFFNRNAQQTVGMASINQEQIPSMPIPFTVTAEQKQIVSEIERCFSVADEIEKVVEQSLKQAERLRQSILKRAFEGKLMPQDPTDEPAEKLLERIKTEKAKIVQPLRVKVK